MDVDINNFGHKSLVTWTTGLIERIKAKEIQMKQRNELSDEEINKATKLVREFIDVRLMEKHRGSYIGNHETYGILAEEFNELLNALQANDNEEFYCELRDIAIGAIIGMASMYVNAKAKCKLEQE